MPLWQGSLIPHQNEKRYLSLLSNWVKILISRWLKRCDFVKISFSGTKEIYILFELAFLLPKMAMVQSDYWNCIKPLCSKGYNDFCSESLKSLQGKTFRLFNN